MHEGDRTESGFAGVAAVDEPGATLADRQRVRGAQFHEHVVRMLAIDEQLAVIRFAGLKEQRRAAWRKSKRLETEHAAQLERSLSDAAHG